MKKLAIVLAIFLLSAIAVQAQGPGPQTQLARKMYSGTAVPTFNCSPGPIWRDIYIRTTTNVRYQCTAAPNTWTPDPVGTVTSVSGVTNETDSTGGATPAIGLVPVPIADNFVSGLATTATAAGTTTLTVASKRAQVFTGSTTQTITLPVVTTLLQVGFSFDIQNDSSGALTINSSGGQLVQTMAAATRATFTCKLLTGTTAASWNVTYTVATAPGGSDTQVQFNNAGAFGGDADMTFVTDTLTVSKIISPSIGATSPGTVGATTLAGSTSTTSPLLIGGSGTTQTLIHKTTTGVGAAGADHIFQVGNNGATEAARILNDGKFGVGVVAPTFKLEVGEGRLKIQQTTNPGFFFYDGATPGTVRASFGTDTAGGNYATNTTAESLVIKSGGGAVYLLTGADAANGITIASGNVSMGGTLSVTGASTLTGGDNIGSANRTDSGGTPSIAGNATLNTGSKDYGGKITSTGTGASTAVITFSITFANAPSCMVTNETTANLVRPVSTTTTLTVNATVVTGDVISYQCRGY